MKRYAFLFLILLCGLAILACSSIPLQPLLPGGNAGNSEQLKLTLTQLFAMSGTLTPPAAQSPRLVTVLVTATPEPVTQTPQPSEAPSASQTPSPTFTPTSTVTLTDVPIVHPTFVTVNPTRVSYRDTVNGAFFSSPPPMGGSWDEWKAAAYTANAIVYGSSEWDGKQDLSGVYKIGWDARFLYVAVRVTDNRYVQNAAGGELYKGDSIEILLDSDLQSDYYVTTLSSDDYQLGISPGQERPGRVPEAFLWYPRSIAGQRNQVEIGAVSRDDGYNLTAAIPWGVFGVTPYKGLRLGFALSISDNDDPDRNVQQKMASGVGDRHLLNPTTWGDLLLVK